MALQFASSGIYFQKASSASIGENPTDLTMVLQQQQQQQQQQLYTATPRHSFVLQQAPAPSPAENTPHLLPPHRAQQQQQQVMSTSKSTTQQQQTTNPRGVPHVYHDYATVPDVAYVRKKTGGVTQAFPEKLYEMLESNPDPDVVMWLPHGRAFRVNHAKLFTATIMPRFFRQTKLTSFQRQLNLYGFRRLTQGVDAGSYYHELFLRGRPALCQRMTRQKIKGTGHKQPSDASSEPNFYHMTCMPKTTNNMMTTSGIVAEGPTTTTNGKTNDLTSVRGAADLLRDLATASAVVDV